MGPFYAHLNDNRGWEYLLTFISREAADEWWRTISAPPSPYSGHIIRNSIQLYTYTNAQSKDIRYFYGDAGSPDVEQFYRRIVYLKRLNKTDAVTIPSITITDHISGRWYFIRSKADPWSHWYVRIKGACLVCGDTHCDTIHVSSEYRTRFCVRALSAHRGAAEETEDFVMIGKDEIAITASKSYVLHINDGDDLKATDGYEGGTVLLFGDLKDRFITQAEKKVNGEVWERVVAVEKGTGEVWELVD